MVEALILGIIRKLLFMLLGEMLCLLKFTAAAAYVQCLRIAELLAIENQCLSYGLLS